MTFASLDPKTISVLLGVPPPIDELRTIARAAWSPGSFRQVVPVSGSNLVQLCNFLRRCRKERAAGKHCNYLVLLAFMPHRDTWHFLSVATSLQLTVVVYGGPCVECSVREIIPSARYAFEWYGQQRYQRHPAFMTYDFQARLVSWRVGTSEPLPSATTTALDKLLVQWKNQRRPTELWHTADNFTSCTSFRGYLATERGNPEVQRAKTAPTSASEMRRACATLGITEAEGMQFESVKKAYRREAKRWHPDKATDATRKEAEQKFQELTVAMRLFETIFNT